MTDFADTPEPPYFAVIFTSLRTAPDPEYDETARLMLDLAAAQPGFLGAESARNQDGFGITVSYWTSEAAIAAWREQADHQVARREGRALWYQGFRVRACRVERAYGFDTAEERQT